jgi:hypothetical protein
MFCAQGQSLRDGGNRSCPRNCRSINCKTPDDGNVDEFNDFKREITSSEYYNRTANVWAVKCVRVL